MKWAARITFLVFVVAACCTVFFVWKLKPSSAGAFAFFACWLLLPYVVMGAALVLLQRKGRVSMPWLVAVVCVSIGGVVFLTDTIVWNPDAQGAIAVMMTPLLQAAALALLLPMASWASRNDRA